MQKNGNSYLLNQDTNKDTIRLIFLGISSLILVGMGIVTALQVSNGGRICVESEGAGKGLTFYFTLAAQSTIEINDG